MATAKDFIVKNGITVSGTASSVSTSTGALQVNGGFGLAGDIWIGGKIVRDGNLTVSSSLGAAFAITSSTFTDTSLKSTVGLSAINYIGSPKIDSTNSGVVITNAAALYIDNAPTTGSNRLSFTNAWATYIKNGNVYIGSNSSNTTTFAGNALQVSGGVGINGGVHISGGGNLYGMYTINDSEIVTRAIQTAGDFTFPGQVTFSTTTNATSKDSGAVVIENGGLGVEKNIYLGGTLVNVSTTNAVSTFSGSIITAGGIGIGKDLYASNGFFVSGNSNASALAGNSLQVTNGGGLGVSGLARLEGTVYLTSSTIATDLGTGALQVTGGISAFNIVAGSAKFSGITEATAPSLASVVITGGLGVGKNVIIGSTSTSFDTTASNALYVAGGVGIAKDLLIGGNAVIQGNLTLLQTGTQLVVNSTQTYIVDPVIDIGGGPNGDPLSIVDIYDKGLLIHYNTGTSVAYNNHAFFGYEHTQGRFILKKNVYPGSVNQFPVTNLLNTGSYATFDLGTLNAKDTTDATNSTTGALTVAGGVGISKQLQVAGTLTVYTNAIVQGDLSVGNSFRITSSTDSTDTNSGALVVSGGVGVGKSLYATTGSFTKAYVTGGFAATSATNGDLVVSGGIGANNVWSRTITVESTLYSNSVTASNALYVMGGIGVNRELTVSGRINAKADVKVGSNLVSSAAVSTSTVDTIFVDIFPATDFTTVKYLIQVTNPYAVSLIPTDFHVSELILVYDGTTNPSTSVYISQYGILTNNGELGTFDGTYAGGLVRLQFTPSKAANYVGGNISVQAMRTALKTGV